MWASRWVSGQYSRTRCSSTALNRQSRESRAGTYLNRNLKRARPTSQILWFWILYWSDTDSDEEGLHVEQDGVEQSELAVPELYHIRRTNYVYFLR